MGLLAASVFFALAAPPQEDVASQVARLLAERCAICHSADSDQPKARKKWPDAADLAATASNPKIVVPGSLDDSELYQVLEFEDMPPEDSDVEPLSAAEKALVASWIEAGAPLPVASEGAGEHDESGEHGEAQEQASDHAAEHAAGGEDSNALLGWLGRFHPMIIHFPLALLAAAFLAELLTRARPAWKTDSAASFCLALGALSALPSASLGWLLAGSLSHSGSDLELHRWLGTSTALLSLIVWWASRRWPRQRLLLMLFVLAGLAAATGHTGGMLSYGADWLDLPF